MASINGVEVKALKGFEGHEGYCFQGNIYKDGKKLGFWSQDSWGGCDRFDFDESILDEACKDFANGFPDDTPHRDIYEEKEVFMGAVLDLKLCEQEYTNLLDFATRQTVFCREVIWSYWHASNDKSRKE